MKLQYVIEQALESSSFAQELKDKCMVAHRAGVDTDEWEDFMSYFADSPQQLAIFRTLHDPNSECTATTGLTTTCASTVACTLTTTTMTTSIFCDLTSESV